MILFRLEDVDGRLGGEEDIGSCKLAVYGIRSTAFPDVTIGISDVVAAVVIEGEDRRDAFPVESIF